MNRRLSFMSISITLMLLFACVRAQTFTYAKPGVDFSKFKRIAIIRFECSQHSIGQEVSDILAMSFMKKNYNVVERSQLRSLIDESAIISAGLTESNRATLKLAGINAIIVGSVTRYDCHPDKVIAPLFGMYYALPTNSCHASLSIKMLDVQSGDILWAANGSHAKNDSGMTAGKVLQKVIEGIEKKIPRMGRLMTD